MQKEYLKKVRLFLILFSLSLGVEGCKNKNSQVGFVIENTNRVGEYHNDGTYIYLINKNELAMQDITPCIKTEPVSFLRVIEQTEINNDFKKKQYAKFIKDEMAVLDENNKEVLSPYLNELYFKTKIEAETLKEYNGYIYTIIKREDTCKKNIKLTENEVINKGDSISSTTVYCEEKVIAYQESASGILDKYLTHKSIGNIDKGLIRVEDNILEDIQYVGIKEMHNLLKYVNEENHNAKTLKRDLRSILMP